MHKPIIKITDKILDGGNISFKEAERIYLGNKAPFLDLIWSANKIRERFKKNRIELCSIINAKSGDCSEDCKFCAQSARHNVTVEKYPLLAKERILKAAENAERNNAGCFGIVTSGRGINSQEEILSIRDAIKDIRGNFGALKCAVSIGMVGERFLPELKKAGLDRFHHNLETSEDYFPKICATHKYQERLRTIKAAKAAGLELCSGGIFGLGERKVDRLKLAFTLRALEVGSVPLNFLHPIKGTALGELPPMPPVEILKVIAIYRIILPRADIKICGGRAVNLRGLQSMIFFAGANGMMIGNYLTQPGHDPEIDLQMVKDLGLRVK